MTKVNSTFIAAVGRIGKNGIEVAFKNGTTRRFGRVTNRKLKELLTSGSVGAFFNMAIRNNPIHRVA